MKTPVTHAPGSDFGGEKDYKHTAKMLVKDFFEEKFNEDSKRLEMTIAFRL